MRNLRLRQNLRYCWKNISTISDTQLTVGEENEVFFFSNLKLYRCFEDRIVSSFDMNTEINQENACIISLKFLSIPQQLCVIFNSGEIFSISADFITTNLQGVCSSDIIAAEFSPDEEILVLVTNTQTLILMNSLYDIITEVDLHDHFFGKGEFINVGWGKKETQFHGSEGKDAAKKKNDIDLTVSTEYNSKMKISWRGDGTLFAVGFMAKDNIVQFKVFNREGVLQFTSEKQAGLECNFCWRPAGNVIATTQSYPNKYVVAFFEKNGLKHGEFVLPFLSTDYIVFSLCWSGDSEALAVRCHSLKDNSTNILIYTTSNYHWYLKQTLIFDSDNRIKGLLWDSNLKIGNGKKMYLVTQNIVCHIYNWMWCVDHSKGLDETDRAIVGVIDGDKALLTDFRYNITPPPMSTLSLVAERNINRIIFGPTSSSASSQQNIDSNSICTLLDDGSLVFYTDNSSNTVLQYKLIGKLNLNYEVNNSKYLSNWLWWSEKIIVCSESRFQTASNLYIIEVIYPEDKAIQLSCKILKSMQLDASVIGFQTILKSGAILIQCDDGKILKLSGLDNLVLTECPSSGKLYSKFEGLLLDEDILIFGLTERNRFYINDIEVADNVTSFFVHSDFLLLINLQHNLLCTELSKEGLEGLKDHKDGIGSCVSQRKMERGAKLVITVPKDTRTILQMPRGNLETVQPRSLSLKLIGCYLDNCKYYQAFDLMRKQRINLNLMYDHNPSLLLNNIVKLINEIHNNSWLSLFLSELENEDVTHTMYASSYYNKRQTINYNIDTNKIMNICSKIREALENQTNYNERILPVLTSYVKMNTTHDLERALLIVKQLRDGVSLKSVKTGVTADEALKYLQYLVHIDKLYDTALGLYDFDLVLFVANKSQKDPKEYVPFLNELNNLEVNYGHFSIDKYLKRYESALVNLQKCGKEHESEILPFVRQHNLYKLALGLFAKNDNNYVTVANEYGNHLCLKKQFSEAGFIYMRCGNLSEAVECFKEALDWETAIQLASQIGWNSEKLTQFFRDMTSHLQENKKYSAALKVMEIYLKEFEKAILFAVEVSHFRTAIRLCQNKGCEEYLESIIKLAALKKLEDLCGLIEHSQMQFIQQKDRLIAVRTEKASKENVEQYNDRDDSDLYSDTSSTMASTATRSSSRSFRSSKNRRKHERKLVSLKEGSRFEDIALIRSLHVLVTTAFKMRTDVLELCFTMHYFDESLKADDLQKKLEVMLDMMKSSFNEIWTSELLKPNQTNTEELNIDSEALASLELHFRIPPAIEEIKWKLNYFA